jgi:hypothetical protein
MTVRRYSSDLCETSEKVLSSEIVAIERARGSARQARSYILAYLYLEERGNRDVA